jgi:L-asparaginase
MEYKSNSEPHITPRIIIHGGAGNISRGNLPRSSYEAYKASLLSVLSSTQDLLSQPDATALDVAVHAVALLEDNPLFNCGKGAVFTRAGTIELEASVMVSDGYRKRGVGCMLLKYVKNPIKLAREMLVRGEKDDGGGAGAHSQLSGEALERLAAQWGIEKADPKYFFTQRRWEEHMRGLEREKEDGETATERIARPVRAEAPVANDPSWDGHEYLPQGTVGAVVLDRFGTICTATSTGGLTNKLPGRIGDTPTLGAGFWAEEWVVGATDPTRMACQNPSAPMDMISRGDIPGLLGACIAGLMPDADAAYPTTPSKSPTRYAVGMSGTGNGDSFLRMNAVRTAAAMTRFSAGTSLAQAIHATAGQGGELERSAGDRFGKTGEGEGGIIGIELVGDCSQVCWDFNCGGMFRAWIDDSCKHRFMVFRDKF